MLSWDALSVPKPRPLETAERHLAATPSVPVQRDAHLLPGSRFEKRAVRPRLRPAVDMPGFPGADIDEPQRLVRRLDVQRKRFRQKVAVGVWDGGVLAQCRGPERATGQSQVELDGDRHGDACARSTVTWTTMLKVVEVEVPGAGPVFEDREAVAFHDPSSCSEGGRAAVPVGVSTRSKTKNANAANRMQAKADEARDPRITAAP